MIGLAAFGVVSAIGGAAQSFGMLVTARVPGCRRALLAPSALSLLTTTFTQPRERGMAFGIYGAIAGAGGAVGLLLGGVLTEYLSWRWCLYVNVVIAVPAVLAAAMLLTNQVPAERPGLDVPGAAAVSLGLFLIAYGFSQAEPRGWTDWETLGSLIVGVILLGVSVVIATTAVSSYLVGKAVTPLVMAQAAVHGYTVAFWWAAGIFLIGALVSGTLLRRGTAVATVGDAQPAAAVVA